MSAAGVRRVAIVGGGVSGLTVAYRLVQADPSIDVTILEAGTRLGGKLGSVEVAGLRLPTGADSFLARKPWAVELCRDLGIDLEAPGASGAYLWTDTGLVPLPKDAPFGIPGDVGDLFRWPGLSAAGKLRAAQDLVRKARTGDDDESLGSLLRRRFGDEATDLALGPLLAGLHAGDVDRLSVRATFPDLVTWERAQGSLFRGSQATSKLARRSQLGPMFVRPRGGVQRLTDELAGRLDGRIRTSAAVTSVESGAVVLGGSDTLAADVIVLATPAHEASRLIVDAAPAVAADLAGIACASTGVVLMVYAEDTQPGLPDGTGFVVPRGKAPMTAATWLSSKWPSEAFGSRAVVRCYVGAVGEEDVLDADDADIVEACARHLAAAVRLPDMPEQATVVRWPASMPQYEVGHLDRVARIRENLPPGIVVVGQPYDGVGVPDCVRAADEVAERLIAANEHSPSDHEETVP
ncbi:MAG TPA: protoporphyrinogen oxidase [Actinomycetota bacterium]|nr:protoporphyrinogen oxidase [Actinomycetota bacterium]